MTFSLISFASPDFQNFKVCNFIFSRKKCNGSHIHWIVKTLDAHFSKLLAVTDVCENMDDVNFLRTQLSVVFVKVQVRV